MFRYDRPQAGRYRQFHQIGAEALGSKGPAVDAEIIETSLGLYRELGLPQLEVRLNSVGCPACRPAFKAVLAAKLEGLKGELCAACLERTVTNPLRVFDCKECGPVKELLPRITDHLCADCRDHFAKLRGMLDEMGIRYALDPLLVRGLDYYTKTAFEILHPSLGAQNALCGGGRYDGLAQECGGPSIPAVGFSAGLERLMEALPASFAAGRRGRQTDVFVVVLDEAFNARALSIARELRAQGRSVLVDLSERSLKRQLKAASDELAPLAAIIGLSEIESGSVALKNMKTGAQRPVEAGALAAAVAGELERTDE
jgi:histidyl-tRNA synthetase